MEIQAWPHVQIHLDNYVLSWGSTCTLVGLTHQSLRTQDYPVTKKSFSAKLFLAKLFLSVQIQRYVLSSHINTFLRLQSIENRKWFVFYPKFKRAWAELHDWRRTKKFLIELWATIFTKASLKFYRSNISAVVCDFLIITASCDLLNWLQGLFEKTSNISYCL